MGTSGKIVIRNSANYPSLEGIYDKYETLLRAMRLLTAQQLSELAAWESENVTGDGQTMTSDWPLWPSIISELCATEKMKEVVACREAKLRHDRELLDPL